LLKENLAVAQPHPDSNIVWHVIPVNACITDAKQNQMISARAEGLTKVGNTKNPQHKC
jgi:hypothetical protein